MSPASEAWLSGPIQGVGPHLMPVAHALVQVAQDVQPLAELTTDELWTRPGGAASVGFHLRHIGGALDRLLTYARGEALLEPREVGKQKLPSNVLGLLYHAAEHATRHAGQAVSTARILRART